MKSIYTLFLLVLPVLSVAQPLEPLEADRPDQTESAATVPSGYIQLELGGIYEHTHATHSEITFPTLLSKYGVNDHFELRLITEVVHVKENAVSSSGLVPVEIGFKANLLQEHGLVPTTSFLGHLSLPKSASSQYTTTYYAPRFRFSMDHSLSPALSFGYNLGAEWDGESAEPIFIYTVTTGFALTDEFGAFLELYGFAPQYASADHRFDAGVTYGFSNDFQVDLAGGVGLSPSSPEYFVGMGASLRFPVASINR